MSRFGELLRKFRKRAGLTQKELAEKVNISDGYICKMETGALRPPSRQVVEDLAKALGIGEKTRLWLKFLLVAGVASEEDFQGLTEVEGEDDTAEEEQQAISIPLPPEEEKKVAAARRAGTAEKRQPQSLAGAGALGAGVGLGAILPLSSTGQQQTETASQQHGQDIGFLVKQIVAAAQLPPEKKILAQRLILENARLVCQVLATEQDQQRR